jgi:hypothetical protein
MRRLLLAIGIGITVMAGTGWYLRPRFAQEADYKFLYCDRCHFELAYTKTLVGERCPHCQPPIIGKLTPTRKSIHDGGGKPWKSFNIALAVEGVCFLGVIVYLLYFPPRREKDDYLYTNCPNCNRKLRYRAERAGASAGWCPGCKAMFAYPTLAEP